MYNDKHPHHGNDCENIFSVKLPSIYALKLNCTLTILYCTKTSILRISSLSVAKGLNDNPNK